MVRFNYILAMMLILFFDKSFAGSNYEFAEVVDIIQKANPQQSSNVLIRMSIDQPIMSGTRLITQRLASKAAGQNDVQQTFVQTGTLIVMKQVGSSLIAQIESESTPESEYFYPHFSGIMVGDRVEIKSPEIVARLEIVPTESISYYDLFVDPTSFPNSFELSKKGKDLLRKIASKFSSLRIPLLLIEGHTDQDGDSEANQIESYQRALTIKQFLVDELGFDERRLAALGMGETEPISEPYLPGHNRLARRIVIQAKPYDSMNYNDRNF